MQDKTITDYYEELYKRFPDVPKSDIKKIVIYGWKSLYKHNSYGGDVLVQFPGFWCYFGNLFRDPLKHFYYYLRKLIVKVKVKYKKNKTPWDGYYYFALNPSQYEEYFHTFRKKVGRRKKYFTFKNIVLYQILEECLLTEHQNKYIFRISMVSKVSYSFFMNSLKTDKAELIVSRDPLKFKDILVSNTKYYK